MQSEPPPNLDIFRPTWGRGLFALALAVAGFLLPQEIPLEWYPLNNPGTDIDYLEISCAANATGQVQIMYDLARQGHRPIDTIRWPISPTTRTFTYTFPLPDAPIVEMRVTTLPAGGELNIRQMRIINRRGEEVRRFTWDMFRAQHEIAAISPSAEGWKLVSTANARDPFTRIELFSPIIPVGYNGRNLHRCLLSTGYLSGMLWILLLAVLFTFYRPAGWRDLFAHLSFMACLAILFAFVGNRGLIRSSVHYARYTSPPIDPGLRLEFDLTSSGPAHASLFSDTGRGFDKAESTSQEYEPLQGLQILRFPLSGQTLLGLRFDPRDRAGRLEIRGIRIVDAGQRTRAVLPFASLVAKQGIARLDATADSLTVETGPGATEPILEFTPAALALIDRTLASSGRADR